MSNFRTSIKIIKAEGVDILLAHALVFILRGILPEGKHRKIIGRDFHDYIGNDNWGDYSGFEFLRLECKFLYGLIRGENFSLSRSLEAVSNSFEKEDIVTLLYNYEGYGRYHSLRPMQIQEEVKELKEIVEEQNPDRILEIGSARNSTLVLWASSGAEEVFSIDFPEEHPGRNTFDKKSLLEAYFNSTSFEFIRGNSHSQQVRAELNNKNEEKFDLIFIDGDHSYEGVKQDFNDYKSLLSDNGILVFHDINSEGCGVPKFWREVSEKYKSKAIEKDGGEGHAGIGIIYVCEKRT